MAAVEYLIYDGSRLVEIKCMKGCGRTIGKLNPKTEKLVAWSNYRTWPLKLSDGSYQNMLVCQECLCSATEDDFEQFDETRQWGWRKELVSKSPQIMTEKLAKRMVDDFCKTKKIVGRLEK